LCKVNTDEADLSTDYTDVVIFFAQPSVKSVIIRKICDKKKARLKNLAFV